MTYALQHSRELDVHLPNKTREVCSLEASMAGSEPRKAAGMIRRNSVFHLLCDCTICHVPASLFLPATQTIYRGALAGLDKKVLTLRIGRETRSRIPDDALGCVSFHYDDRPYVFLGQVVGQNPRHDPETTMVLVKIPTSIMVDTRRLAHRVPVLLDSPLRVQIETDDGRAWPTLVRSISVSGTMIELPGTDILEPVLGPQVGVDLRLHDWHVQCRADIVCRDKRCYGLSFVVPTSDPDLTMPTLHAIVRAIETHWSTSR
jgi:hypothetical protein